MKGLSSTALQNTTSFAGPMQLRSAVSSADCLTICPISLTASIFIPDFVEPIFTDEQMFSVTERASGIDFISSISPALKPLWTSAEYPPMKFTPQVSAAF